MTKARGRGRPGRAPAATVTRGPTASARRHQTRGGAARPLRSPLVLERRIGLAVLVGSLVLGAALRLWLVLTDDGFYWPDEVYQSVEPAHRLVFGYGLLAWEFVDGARNWAFPGLVALPLKLISLVGVSDPRVYLLVLKLLFAGISLAAPIGAYFLARGYGARPIAAAAGAAVVALAAPMIYFAPRGLSEGPSAGIVVSGFAFALWPAAGQSRRAVGASLVGLSVLLRLQNALFAVGLVGIFAGRREWRKATEAAAVLAIWAVLLGGLDKLTWGGWFASVLNYVAFNLDPVKTAIFEKPPADYYILVAFTAMALPVIAFLLLAPFGALRAPGITLIALAFIAVHSAIAHKELRFILPAIPLVGSVAAVGLQHLLDDPPESKWVSRAIIAGFVACGLVSAATFRGLTLRDIGQSQPRSLVDHGGGVTLVSPDTSAYDQPGPINRLLLRAHDQADLCGLRIEPFDLVQSGGYSYLHRPVPLYGSFQQADPAFYNYAIAYGAVPAGEVVSSEGGFSLIRTRPSCARDPAFYRPPPAR